MSDYNRKILNLNPIEHYNVESINTYLYYDTDTSNVFGGIFNEIDSNDVLSPVLTTVIQKPINIDFFGKSVTSNEKYNNSLLIGNINERLYNIYYNSTKPVRQMSSSNLSFQFSIPNQQIPDLVKLVDYDDIQVYDNGVLLGSVSLNGNTWTFTDDRPFTLGESRLYELKYRSTPIEDSVNLTASNTSSLIGYSQLQIDRTPDAIVIGQQITIENITYIENGTRYNIDKSIGVVKKNSILTLEGYYRKPISVTSVEYVKAFVEQRTTLIQIDDFNVDVGIDFDGEPKIYFSQLNFQMFYNLEYEKNYNISINQTYTNKILYYNIHINGVYIGVPFSVVYKTPINKTFSNYSRMYVSNRFDILTYQYNNYLTGNRLIVYVDNISIFNKVLSINDIVSLHKSTLEYFDVIKFSDPTHDFVFDDVFSNVKSRVSSVQLYAKNSNTDSSLYRSLYNGQSKSEFNEIYPYSVEFKNTQLHSTSRLINMNTNFSIIIWFKTNTLNTILLSQSDYAKPYYGLSIHIENGFIVYWSGGIKYSTDFYVSNGQTTMLCVIRDGNSVRTYSPLKHDSTKQILTISNTFINQTNILHEPNNHDDSVVSLAALTIFDKKLDTFDIDELFKENNKFTVDGVVLLRNVPVNTKVRVIDHFTGELLDVVYTDFNGYFRWDNIFKRSVDLLIYHEGRIQMIGQIITQSRTIWLRIILYSIKLT